MMQDFLRFIDSKVGEFPLHIEICYNKMTDWCIYIYKKGCAKDYPESWIEGDNAILCNVSSCDMELTFAMAHVKVKEWLSEYEGGY